MYIFYLNDIPLPVTPAKLKMKFKNKNETMDLVNGSEVNLLRLPGLTEIEFDAMLPVRRYPFAVYGGQQFRPPQYYLEALEELKTGCKPFDFYIMRINDLTTTAAFNTSMKVTLEDYDITEDAADGSDITAGITLRQYAERVTKTVTVMDNGEVRVSEDREMESDPPDLPPVYTVAEGDSLWELARIYYGDGERWTEIFEKNKYIIDAAALEGGNLDSFGGQILVPGTVIEL